MFDIVIEVLNCAVSSGCGTLLVNVAMVVHVLWFWRPATSRFASYVEGFKL